MPEPPYGMIANLLVKGEIVPFLGAGASLSGRPVNAKWTPKTANFLPTSAELAHQLADDSSFPSSDELDRGDLTKVSSYFAEEAGDRLSLVSYMHDTFAMDYQPGDLHHFLAALDTPLLIVTTNYDDLIERAFRARGRPFHLVTYPTDRKELAASVLWWKPGATAPEDFPPKNLPLSLADTTIIYKMHGSVDRAQNGWDSFVVTEDDYVDFITRMTGQTAIPARFMLEFRKRRFLFLGYGLHDWNFRVMLKNLRRSLTIADIGGPIREAALANPNLLEQISPEVDLRSWAIQRAPTTLETALWHSRKVSLFDVDLDAFIKNLSEKL